MGNNVMKQIKYFAPEEATKTLPLVKQIVKDIIVTGEIMREVAAKVTGDVTENFYIQELAGRINNYMIELEEIGCFYKDWNFTIGLVDFPALIHGKKVMLCWRSDEDEIKFYHDIDSGYAGRKLIPEECFYVKV